MLRSCSPLPWWSLLLLATAAASSCPLLTGLNDAPSKAYLAPVVFHGRLAALARRGPAQQATFLVDKVFKSPQPLPRSAVVEFAHRRNSSKCRGAPYSEGALQLAGRYVVFAARRRGKMIAVAQPEPYSKRKAVSRVLCANCEPDITNKENEGDEDENDVSSEEDEDSSDESEED